MRKTYKEIESYKDMNEYDDQSVYETLDEYDDQDLYGNLNEYDDEYDDQDEYDDRDAYDEEEEEDKEDKDEEDEEDKDEEDDAKGVYVNPLQIYIEEISKLPLLSDDEVKELSERIKKGDKEAEKKLADGNYRLVIKFAKHYLGCGIELIDLIQFGNMGLLEAVKRYDHNQGKFSTYAEFWIKNAIQKELPLSSDRYKKLKQIQNARTGFQQKYGCTPTIEELAEETGFSRTIVKNILEIERDVQTPFSLQKSIGMEEDGPITWQDRVQSKEMAVEDQVVGKLGVTKLDSVIGRLEDDEQNQKVKETWKYLKAQEIGLEDETWSSNDFERVEKDENLNVYMATLANILSEYQDVPMTKVEARILRKLQQEKERLSQNPSGETEILDELPLQNAWIFEDMDEEDIDAEIQGYLGSQNEEDFFDAVAEIKSTPPYKCVVRYLLEHYHIIISEDNEEKLWEVLEENSTISVKKIKEHIGNTSPAYTSLLEKLRTPDCEDVDFTEEECTVLLTMLLKYLRDDYEKSGIKVSNWTAYFGKLLNDLEADMPQSEVANTSCMDELALATRMDIDTYHNFRKKLLKRREYDYLNEQYIFMFLTLKYAKACDMLNYKEAYDLLVDLYKDVSLTEEDMADAKNSDIASSIMINEKYLQRIEMFNKLKEKYRRTLFKETMPELQAMMKQIQMLKHKNVQRSDEKVFLEEWETLEKNMQTTNRSDILRILYGEKNQSKGNSVLRNKDFFIDTKEFAHTYIEDNIFDQFNQKSDRNKRNLILTLIFLNLSFDLQGVRNVEYEEILEIFEARVLEKLGACGFRILHSGSAYDTYLKFLFASPDPLETFKYVWKKKLGIAGGIVK